EITHDRPAITQADELHVEVVPAVACDQVGPGLEFERRARPAPVQLPARLHQAYELRAVPGSREAQDDSPASAQRSRRRPLKRENVAATPPPITKPATA